MPLTQAKKLAAQAKQRRLERGDKRRRQVTQCQLEDIVISPRVAQGRELHEALGHKDIEDLTAKLPVDSLARAVIHVYKKW